MGSHGLVVVVANAAGWQDGFVLAFLLLSFVISLAALAVAFVALKAAQGLEQKFDESLARNQIVEKVAVVKRPELSEFSPSFEPEAVPVQAKEIEPGLFAVIAAAIHVALTGTPHRIISISTKHSDAWAFEGRRQIFASHRIR